MVNRSPDTSSFPHPLTGLIGREGVLAPVLALLRREGVRLVTLSGPGGVGKTRLALQVSDICAPEFPDGVVFVDLAAISDPDLVLPAIARALNVRETGGRPLLDVLAQALTDRRLLVVLDNVEHVIEAAPSVADLLARCPQLKVLATSRIVLRVSGEWELPVPPLALPALEPVPPADLATVESVALFVERARAADAGFRLNDANGQVVTEICRRLDGLPLAIELGAARLRHLSLETLLERLDARLPLLAGGPRDQPARLQTMRNAIGWSYDLLGEADQVLFQRLAVFSGGFSLAAATQVAGDGEEFATLDGVGRLVECSLVRLEKTGNTTPSRYSMLETIREYGREQLAASGESASIQRRHADWCLDLVDRAWPAFASRVNSEPWLNLLATEHGNLRAALAWLTQAGHAGEAVRLAGGMFWFWFVRSHFSEGRANLNRVLALPDSDDVEPVDRARALLGAGLLAHFQGDDAAAAPLVEAALAQSRASGFSFGQAAAALTLGIIAEDSGDYGAAEPYLEEALDVSREAGDRANEALALYHRGVMYLGQGMPDRAATLCEAALAIQQEIGDRWGAANAQAYLGLILGHAGEHLRAAEMLRESLLTRRALGLPEDLANGIAHVATLAARCQEPAQAARLFGAETALRESIGTFRKLPERVAFEQAEAATLETLGPDQFAAIAGEGRRLGREQAVELAIAFTPATPDRLGPDNDDRPDRLTEREQEVLVQLASGKTNPEIAQELYISPGTVRTHVSSILGKLGARTRTEAADLARRRGLL